MTDRERLLEELGQARSRSPSFSSGSEPAGHATSSAVTANSSSATSGATQPGMWLEAADAIRSETSSAARDSAAT